MRISTKGRYALRILLDIAIFQKGNEPRSIHEISESQKLSEKYVGRLILKLRSTGFLKSRRGTAGGYFLRRRPEDITLLEILEKMEGKVSVVECVRNPRKCRRSELCSMRKMWDKLNDGFKDLVNQITLAEIVEDYKKGEGASLMKANEKKK